VIKSEQRNETDNKIKIYKCVNFRDRGKTFEGKARSSKSRRRLGEIV